MSDTPSELVDLLLSAGENKQGHRIILWADTLWRVTIVECDGDWISEPLGIGIVAAEDEYGDWVQTGLVMLDTEGGGSDRQILTAAANLIHTHSTTDEMLIQVEL